MYIFTSRCLLNHLYLDIYLVYKNPLIRELDLAFKVEGLGLSYFSDFIVNFSYDVILLFMFCIKISHTILSNYIPLLK